jgi:hypothetical protein
VTFTPERIPEGENFVESGAGFLGRGVEIKVGTKEFAAQSILSGDMRF